MYIAGFFGINKKNPYQNVKKPNFKHFSNILLCKIILYTNTYWCNAALVLVYIC